MSAKMSQEEFERYTSFMNNRRVFRKQQTPESKQFFYEQVKQRVINFLEVTGNHDLQNLLARAFWGTSGPYDDERAMKQAIDLGYVPEDGTINSQPYFWYLLLKPRARKLANDAKAFTGHFEKMPAYKPQREVFDCQTETID